MKYFRYSIKLIELIKIGLLISKTLDDSVRMMEIYHATQQGMSNVILTGNQREVVVPDARLYERTIARRLSRPAMIAYVDLEKIEFERFEH